MLSACARQPEGYSVVRLATPTASKIGALAAVPAGRTLCYGVSIKGSGIASTPATSCKPEVGTLLGFVGPNGELKGEVLKGDARTFDVFLWVQKAGDNLPCPAGVAGLASIPSNQLYLLGSVPNIKLALDSETVSIPTTYPGDANHLAQINSYPSSCSPSLVASASAYQISTAEGVVTGAGYILQGRVGRVTDGPILTGAGIKLRVKE